MAKLSILFFCNALFKVLLSSFPTEKKIIRNLITFFLAWVLFLFRGESIMCDYRTLKCSTQEHLLKIPLTTASCKVLLRLPFYPHALVYPVMTAALHFIQKV